MLLQITIARQLCRCFPAILSQTVGATMMRSDGGLVILAGSTIMCWSRQQSHSLRLYLQIPIAPARIARPPSKHIIVAPSVSEGIAGVNQHSCLAIVIRIATSSQHPPESRGHGMLLQISITLQLCRCIPAIPSETDGAAKMFTCGMVAS